MSEVKTTMKYSYHKGAAFPYRFSRELRTSNDFSNKVNKLSHRELSDVINKYYSAECGLYNFTHIDTESFEDINMSYGKDIFM